MRKKLHWHAIKMKEEEVSVVSTHQTQVKESYWGGLEKLALIQNDMDKMKEFEDIFVNNPDENKQKEVKPVEKDKGPKLVSVSRGAELQVTFLDGKRSTNIGIAMSKVKADYASLRRALLLMKPELANITMDTVESLRVALPTAEDLRDFCRARLANYKLPREFVIVEDFPRNGTGKVLKTELRRVEPA